MKRLFLVLSLSLIPASASAGVSITAYSWDCEGFVYCNSSADAVTGILGKLIAWIVVFIVPLAVVVFFYGALRMAVSRGEEGKETGKKALIYASIGLAAAILTSAIISFIQGYIYTLGA